MYINICFAKMSSVAEGIKLQWYSMDQKTVLVDICAFRELIQKMDLVASCLEPIHLGVTSFSSTQGQK